MVVVVVVVMRLCSCDGSSSCKMGSSGNSSNKLLASVQWMEKTEMFVFLPGNSNYNQW